MPTSANTCVRKIPALAKKVEEFFGWTAGSKNLDIGAGKYQDFSDYLHKKRVKNLPYDPYNRPAKENDESLAACPADTVTISDVLNVVQKEEDRIAILKLAKSHARKAGRVYISVYEGDKSGEGKESKKDCWQEHRKLTSYFPEVEKVFNCAIIIGRFIVCFNA